MRNIRLIYIFSFLLIIGCKSQPHSAAESSGSSLDLEVPKLYARVNDYADILSEDEEMELDGLLKSLEDSIGSQLAVLTIVSLGGETIEEYSIRVASNWRIGRINYDDGILITLAMKDREIRIEVGYGLEKIIRDEIAKKIIVQTMVPEFRDGHFYSGLTKASEEIIDLIYQNPELVGER